MVFDRFMDFEGGLNFHLLFFLFAWIGNVKLLCTINTIQALVFFAN